MKDDDIILAAARALVYAEETGVEDDAAEARAVLIRAATPGSSRRAEWMVGREREAYDAGRLAGYEDGVTDTENRLATEFYAAAKRAEENKGDLTITLIAKTWRQAAAVVYGGRRAIEGG